MVGRGVTVGASRTFAIVSKMFNWAVAEGLLEHTPCAGMRKPFKTGERERVLCDGELRAFWNGLPKAKISKDGQAVLKLCLITSQRLGEVAGMSKDEFNLETCVWTIPSDRFSPGGRAAGFQGGLDRVFPGLWQKRRTEVLERRQGRAAFARCNRDRALDRARLERAPRMICAELRRPIWLILAFRRTSLRTCSIGQA
jgi:hypothetical protein